MATKYLLLSVAFLAILSISNSTKYTDCGSTTGQVKSVEVDCQVIDDVCILKRGGQAGINISFIAKSDSSTLKAVVHGVIATVPLPFPIPNPDGCKSGVTCPVKNGASYIYSNSLNVRKSYPPVGVTVRWELKDDQSKDMVCVEILAKLE